jgi:trk system potassium uptake protein TrkH
MDIKKFTPPRILVAGFALVILIGAFLLALPWASVAGQELSFLDALFTSTSAVCVTGLTVTDTAANFTLFGEVIILLLIQIGGLGFMTFATLFAIILGKKITLRERLVLQEALNQITLEGIVSLAKSVMQISLVIEALGTLILTLRWSLDFTWGKAFYYGLFHAVSAFNNAGFDLFGKFSSLTAYTGDLVVNITIMLLIIAGGLGFTVIAALYPWRHGKLLREKRMSLQTKLVLQATAILIFLGTGVILLLEYANPLTLGPLPWGTKILAAFFQAVSPRTAGFNTIDLMGMHETTLLFMIVLMFVGASPGSTGGGIKTTTFITLLFSVLSTYRNEPYVVVEGRTLPNDLIRKALAVAASAACLVILVTFILTITEHTGLFPLLFEATSAFGTVGLTLGVTLSLSAFGKAVIMLTMFAGRLGPLTLVFFLSRRKAGSAAQIKYPEERIIIS